MRSLSFLTLKSFHTSQVSMRLKFLETQTKSCQLSKISSKLSLLVSPLVLQIENAQMRPKGSKMRGYIRIKSEGKLESHQIDGSLYLEDIIVHLPLPQLMPHFGTLHWWMGKCWQTQVQS